MDDYALMGALRTRRDRAMVPAMLLGGLRRCEVLGVRMSDVHPGEKRLFIVDGKGGHVTALLHHFGRLPGSGVARHRVDGSRVRGAIKDQRHGLPLGAAGLDEIIAGARRRAGIEPLTCHQLRHTCRAVGVVNQPGTDRSGQIAAQRIPLHPTTTICASLDRSTSVGTDRRGPR